MTRALGVLAGLSFLAISSPGIADSDSPYIAAIAIERSTGSSGALGESVVSTLHVTEPQKTVALLSQVDGLDVTDAGESTVRIRANARPTLSASPRERHRQSTWVLDFDEGSIQQLVGQLATHIEDTPSPAQLEQFVFDHVTNKSYVRSFDLASRVAATQEGDCTEHAVLLAALARAHGYPARVVFGNLVLELDQGLFAFGHAWTEVHVGERWQILDATMPDNDAALRQVRYIPAGDLQDEGPAYFLSLVEILAAMPSRISEVGGSP